jgi:response regulator RpfG family c-di-GMP phosphodiesterase
MADSQRQIILMLTQAIEERSRETGNHVRRVSAYAGLLGRLYGLSQHDIDILPLAVALHDVGKIAIPDAILHKPGRLDPAEREIMKSHAVRGQELLQSHGGDIMQAAALVAGQHHEKWSGEGYPKGLKGSDTHVFARIASLVDVFDALTTQRCYKEPWPVADAVDYLKRESAKQFDPDLVELMLANLDKFLEIMQAHPDHEAMP